MDHLVNQLPCGVVLIDEDGLIFQINATTEQQLGYRAAELLGQSVRKILSTASWLFYQTHFYPLLTLHHRVDEMALSLLTKTGERIPVLLNAIFQPQGDQMHIHCVYFPISQRHQYEAELIQARKDAEQARIAVERSEAKYRALSAELEIRIQERTHELQVANSDLNQVNQELERSNEALLQFASIASHDLQEPLRKIQAFSDILKHQYASQLGTGTDYVDRMQAAGGRMTTLIRDLLALARMSNRPDTTAPLALSEVIQTVLMDLEVRIQESGAIVEVSPMPILPGDGLQLGQLFLNLVSNALKFQPAGIPPIVRIHAYRQQANQLPAFSKPLRAAPLYHCIEVADNGIGFDEKYGDRIFQVFQRLHGKHEYAGTGIGLSICEKVVTNHGGAITASSRPGQGAVFSVYLPA
ncbi:hypothetical protein GCM10028808_57190 [Spirosoma migulaei]